MSSKPNGSQQAKPIKSLSCPRLILQEAPWSLLIASYEKVKAKNTNAWALIEKWWTEIPNMTVPIGVEKGAATFTADGVQKVIPFTAKYPK